MSADDRARPESSIAGSGEDERARWGVDGLALGISLGGATGPAEWAQGLDWVDWAEANGLHSVWLPEMHFTPGGNTSPLQDLSAFAVRTRRLRLATTSILLPIHHPLRVAAAVAQLDQLSGGRVILGLGRGFRAPLFAAFGVDPTSKRDRFDESLDLILRAWRGEPISLEGTRFADAGDAGGLVAPAPLQSPHPPLAVAAFGRKGLEQAARRGLPYLASPMEPFDLIADNLDFHRERRAARVDPGSEVVPIMRTVFVTEDERTAVRVLAGIEAESMRGPRANVKLPPAIARAMTAPISERVIVGNADAVTERIARYRERLGMNLLVVRPQLRGTSASEREQSLASLVEKVLPAIAPESARPGPG
jgi:alkanesulfonate monooxygenase SsuD/methylene tetrahydromethanopterin reductase-like flavin-dependent oxidoreductase (luciferase family)